ncbi:hypothetical protein CBS101457_003762 [Exobasidium rhododendri]|nr:hypothetical protein CBS101457_003762 [Exobasidium rhododendri]
MLMEWGEEEEGNQSASFRDLLHRWNLIENKLDDTLEAMEVSNINPSIPALNNGHNDWKPLPSLPLDSERETAEEEYAYQDDQEEVDTADEASEGRTSYSSDGTTTSGARIRHAYVHIISTGAGGRGIADFDKSKSVEILPRDSPKKSFPFQPTPSDDSVASRRSSAELSYHSSLSLTLQGSKRSSARQHSRHINDGLSSDIETEVTNQSMPERDQVEEKRSAPWASVSKTSREDGGKHFVTSEVMRSGDLEGPGNSAILPNLIESITGSRALSPSLQPCDIWTGIERSQSCSNMTQRYISSMGTSGTPYLQGSSLATAESQYSTSPEAIRNPLLLSLSPDLGQQAKFGQPETRADGNLASNLKARPPLLQKDFLTQGSSDRSRLPGSSPRLDGDAAQIKEDNTGSIKSSMDKRKSSSRQSQFYFSSLPSRLMNGSIDSAASTSTIPMTSSSENVMWSSSGTDTASPGIVGSSSGSILQLPGRKVENESRHVRMMDSRPTNDAAPSKSRQHAARSKAEYPSYLMQALRPRQRKTILPFQEQQERTLRSPSSNASSIFRSPSPTNSTTLALKDVKTSLEDGDIELMEQNTILTDIRQTNLYDVRRRLVNEFETLGAKSGRRRSKSYGTTSSLISDGRNAVESSQRPWNLTLASEKEAKRSEEAIEVREKDLTIEALSKAEMASVKIEIWTESRKGKWTIRGPVSDDGYPPEDLSQDIDPWSVPIDSKGTVHRKKLKSNTEISSTRTVVMCPDCAKFGKVRLNSHCRTCDDYGRVEMVYSIQCVIRLAQFLPLKLPSVLLLGCKQSHIKYMDAIEHGQCAEILRDRVLDGLQSAANRVVKAHYSQHGSRLLMGRATIIRRGLLSVSVTSSRYKVKRWFDVEDGPDGKIIEVTDLRAENQDAHRTGKRHLSFNVADTLLATQFNSSSLSHFLGKSSRSNGDTGSLKTLLRR